MIMGVPFPLNFLQRAKHECLTMASSFPASLGRGEIHPCLRARRDSQDYICVHQGEIIWEPFPFCTKFEV